MKISKEFKIGLMAISAMVILYFGFNFLKGVNIFSSNKKYYALYKNIDGLQTSNPVIINGLNVGRVSKVGLQQGNGHQVLVEIDIAGDIVLGDSTVALLANKDFLGSKAIILNIEKQIGQPLEDGDTLISELDKGLADLLNESVIPVADNIETTIRQINVILDNLEGVGTITKSTLTTLQEATQEVNATIIENRKALNQSTQNLAQVSKKLSYLLDDISPVVGKMSQFADSLNTMEMNKTINEANKTIAELNSTIVKINDGEGTLGKLAANDSLYNNLNKSAESLDKLLIDLKANPKRYVHFSLFGRKD